MASVDEDIVAAAVALRVCRLILGGFGGGTVLVKSSALSSATLICTYI